MGFGSLLSIYCNPYICSGIDHYSTEPCYCKYYSAVHCASVEYGASLYEKMAIDDGLPGTGLGDNAYEWCKSGDPMLATVGF